MMVSCVRGRIKHDALRIVRRGGHGREGSGPGGVCDRDRRDRMMSEKIKIASGFNVY